MAHTPSPKKLLLLAAPAALLAACAAVQPVTQAWSPPPVGATWTMAERNTGSFGPSKNSVMTRLDTSWNGQPAVMLKNTTNGAAIVTQPAGKWQALIAPDGKPAVTFDPPLGFSYPLTVGKEWAVKQRMTMVAQGRTVEFDYSCKVMAFEKVTVPAGNFDAFKIVCSGIGGTQDVMWSSPGFGPFVKVQFQRGPAHPAGAGTQYAELVAQTIR